MKPKKSISRIAMIAGAIMITTAVTSCGSDTLNPRQAKSALEKEAMFSDSSCVKSFNTGFYEVNPAQLNQLKQLRDAGMIDLTTSSVIEKKKVNVYSYWSGYTSELQNVEHTFANVTLTDAARKYEVSHVVRFRDDIEKDLKLREGIISEPTPDYILSNNDLNTGAGIEEIVAETADAEEEVAAATDSVSEASQPAAKPQVTVSDYENALSKVSAETHEMLLGKYELVKVTEVFCPENMKENGVGSCSYIYRFIDKTPFGHVFDAPETGKLSQGHATFRRYVDMGWIVEQNNPE